MRRPPAINLADGPRNLDAGDRRKRPYDAGGFLSIVRPMPGVVLLGSAALLPATAAAKMYAVNTDPEMREPATGSSWPDTPGTAGTSAAPTGISTFATTVPVPAGGTTT